MKKTIFGLLVVALLLVSAPMFSQFGPQMPAFNGVWNPVVGLGAVYETVGKDNQTHPMTIAVVGKDTIDGKEGFWFEMIFDQRGKPMVIQEFRVQEGASIKTLKTIMQDGDKTPMEMPDMSAMMGRASKPSAARDFRESTEDIGMESVTTPAGTFECDHRRNKDGSEDTWLSAKVPPWGIVKSVGKANTMVLIRVLTDAKSHLNGKPVKFDPSMFGR